MGGAFSGNRPPNVYGLSPRMGCLAVQRPPRLHEVLPLQGIPLASCMSLASCVAVGKLCVVVTRCLYERFGARLTHTACQLPQIANRHRACQRYAARQLPDSSLAVYSFLTATRLANCHSSLMCDGRIGTEWSYNLSANSHFVIVDNIL
jgi:hypothetical protein